MNKILKTYTWLFLFSVTMGYLESAVVIYIRELVYPNGFEFPLRPVKFMIVHTETWREAATILMLLAVGILAGRTKLERFGMFLFNFAIWDLSYYLFLYLILAWPSSLFTWDILFFIPSMWTGPVITPVIISVIMIMYSILFSLSINKNNSANLKKAELIIMSIGIVVLIGTFMLDYLLFINKELDLLSYFVMNKYEKSEYVLRYIPKQFNYLLFSTGILGLLIPLFLFYKREVT